MRRSRGEPDLVRILSKYGLHRAPLQRVMDSASRRASFHAVPVVVIADRREHMISPEPGFLCPPYPFGHTRECVRWKSAAARASRRQEIDGIAPAPMGATMTAALRFRRRNQHLRGRLSHDR